MRSYTDDVDATRAVFEKAVRLTASNDYTSEEVEAGALRDLDSYAWAASRAAAVTVVAVEHDRTIGFADLVQGTLLDMLSSIPVWAAAVSGPR